MLATDVWDKMCLWQIKDVDSFGHLGHQYPLFFYNRIGHQHWKDVTNIFKSSPTVSHKHHDFTNENHIKIRLIYSLANRASSLTNHTLRLHAIHDRKASRSDTVLSVSIWTIWPNAKIFNDSWIKSHVISHKLESLKANILRYHSESF